jgi:hypothetical protein
MKVMTRPRPVGLARGVQRPRVVAEFYGWLLDLEVDTDRTEFRLGCSNGWPSIHGDRTRPASLVLASTWR